MPKGAGDSGHLFAAANRRHREERGSEAAHHAEALAKMAAEETGFGNWRDKVLKNRFASLRVYDAIKDMKTVGIIHDDQVQK